MESGMLVRAVPLKGTPPSLKRPSPHKHECGCVCACLSTQSQKGGKKIHTSLWECGNASCIPSGVSINYIMAVAVGGLCK